MTSLDMSVIVEHNLIIHSPSIQNKIRELILIFNFKHHLKKTLLLFYNKWNILFTI